MQFNKLKRGANREMNNEQTVYEILDAGFLCHIAFQHEGTPMIIPTAYGRKDDCLYFHGNTKNFMMNQIINGNTISVAVTHLDGIVLARTLFDTSANYRSVVLFGKAERITDHIERIEGLKTITENIIKGRFDEVPIGTENELKATMVVKFKIESATAKIRAGAPQGDDDETNETWSGHIPLKFRAEEPVQDNKFGTKLAMTDSVLNFWNKNK